MMWKYYENGFEETITPRLAYHLFITMVDKAETDFQSWICDMKRSGIFIPA